MSFKPTPSATELCNRALSRLSQERISGIEPPSPNGKPARACATWYKPTVGRLLEMHHWQLARRRVTLSEVTNDREVEWLYKYALPTDCAFVVTLAPYAAGSSNIQYYRGLQGLIAQLNGRPMFLRTGNFLYTQVSDTIDYVSYDITEGDFNATFENIVELSLAAAICFDITKSRTREEELRQQATGAMNLAIAQDLNAGNPTYGDEPSSRDIARGAIFNPSLPWDWWPGSRP